MEMPGWDVLEPGAFFQIPDCTQTRQLRSRAATAVW